MTNGDKIRSMSDEGLAKIMYDQSKIVKSGCCLGCIYKNSGCKDDPCMTGIANFLKSEAE